MFRKLVTFCKFILEIPCALIDIASVIPNPYIKLEQTLEPLPQVVEVLNVILVTLWVWPIVVLHKYLSLIKFPDDNTSIKKS